jgi:hypothetical protein
MKEQVVYSWESLPEYRYTQRYAYSLGRVLASLKPRWRRRFARCMSQSATLIATGITMANLDLPPGAEPLPVEDREEARQAALDAVALAREVLRLLQEARQGSAPDILVALDLLERVEEAMRRRPLE